MPPISSQETIPNFPLNGHELALYAVKVFEQVCKERNTHSVIAEAASKSLQQALENDWMFKPTYLCPGVSCEISLESHVIENHESCTAFTLDVKFKFPYNSAMPEAKPFVRRPLNCPAPPIETTIAIPPDARHIVDCFTLAVEVTNPNLVRVHCGMPITITEKVPPKHGEMFGGLKNHEVRYDPSGYDALPPPLVTDRSQEFATKWGLDGVEVYFPAVGVHLGAIREWPEDAELVAWADEPEPNRETPDSGVETGAKVPLEMPKPTKRNRGRN